MTKLPTPDTIFQLDHDLNLLSYYKGSLTYSDIQMMTPVEREIIFHLTKNAIDELNKKNNN